MSILFEQIRRVLYQCFDREELVGIQYEPDAFEVGFVRSIDGENFRLERIDRYGQSWGSFHGTVDKVVRVQYGSQHMQAAQLLIERLKSGFSVQRGAPESLETIKILEFVTQNNLLVGIYNVEGVVLYGYVRSYSEEHVELEEISYLGNEDGRKLFPFDDIMRVTYGGPDEESRMFLNRVRLGL